MTGRPLIAHVLYRLDTGGMEQMLVKFVNHTSTQYRHAIICLDDFSTFRNKIVDPDVSCVALHKKPGKDFGCYLRLGKALRRLKPDLVHTYNIGALDAALVARLAGVRHVIHAERGRDAGDPNGEIRKYQRLRRWLAPCIERFVAVSDDLAEWLTTTVGIDAARVIHIPNGVDLARFPSIPHARTERPLLGEFAPPGTILIGTVGRLDPVKDQAGLIRAFGLLREAQPELGDRLRLVIVGKGPARAALERQIAASGLDIRVRLLGNREDVPALLAEFDVFVLSSIAEGMPGAVLEAMASRLPVVATEVGGTGEVVTPGVTGRLVPASQPQALCNALAAYVTDPVLRAHAGAAGRRRVEDKFNVRAMVTAYVALYDQLLDRPAGEQPSCVVPDLVERREH